MDNHFEPLEFTIKLDFNRSALDKDGPERSVLIHEYIHYLQSLTSTIGRILMFDMSRHAIMAGHWKFHGGTPDVLDPICLNEVFATSSAEDFGAYDAKSQYVEILSELQALLHPAFELVEAAGERPVIVMAPLSNFPRKAIAHVIMPRRPKATKIPLTDRVFFENAARQVQRNYLYCWGDVSFVDDRQRTIAEDEYLCIFRLIEPLTRGNLEPRALTIALCQFCLLTAEPHEAFKIALDQLDSNNERDLSVFLKNLRWKQEIKRIWNAPPYQEVLDSLLRIGKSLRLIEDHELNLFCKRVAYAYNVLEENPAYYSGPVMIWDDFLKLVNTFDCPRIQCKDGPLEMLGPVRCDAPWIRFLQRSRELLAD